jgi:hypothetical protein
MLSVELVIFSNDSIREVGVFGELKILPITETELNLDAPRVMQHLPLPGKHAVPKAIAEGENIVLSSLSDELSFTSVS